MKASAASRFPRIGGVLVMAASTSSGKQRELDQTATWAVFGVCAVMLIISILLEKILHKLGNRLRERRENALFKALEKVKTELMLVGFISLLLNFTEDYVAKICIPNKVADTMLPCRAEGHQQPERRSLASADTATTCNAESVPIISLNGLHQLHILIFFLAFFHVIHSLIAMMLGRLKIHGWKKWEQETSFPRRELSNDPSKAWTRVPVFRYIDCFFRWFFKSVRKSDYLTLRTHFITVHSARGSVFSFQNLIKRSLDNDFKVVVGVSPVSWGSFLLYLLLNVGGWETLFWASLIPAIIILAVGTNLLLILTQMTGDINEGHAGVQGMPDKYFWFGRPQLVLHLIHFVLFQNAFQTTYFLWIWYSFGMESCFHSNFMLSIMKVLPGVGVLIVCSYNTLPLYELVAQMSSRLNGEGGNYHTEPSVQIVISSSTSHSSEMGEGGISHTDAPVESGSSSSRSDSSGAGSSSTSRSPPGARSSSSTSHSPINNSLPGGQPIINNSLPGDQPVINNSLPGGHTAPALVEDNGIRMNKHQGP